MDKEELQKKEVALAVVAVILLVSAAIYFNFFMGTPETDNGSPGIDRSLDFPEDEGSHDEVFESWEFMATFETDEGAEFEMVTAFSNRSDDILIQYQLIDNDKKSGEKYYIDNLEGGKLEAARDEMLVYLSKKDFSTNINSQGESRYTLQNEYPSGIKIEMNIMDKKGPVLWGGDGKLYHPDLGTIFGYSQPHFTLDGNISIPGKGSMKITGTGWLEHVWGGDIVGFTQEEWQIQLDNSVEIFLSKSYDPKKSHPEDLLFYMATMIHKNGDTIKYELEESIKLQTLDYRIIPASEDNSSCWAHKWRIKTNNMDITITPSMDEGTSKVGWLGFAEVKGEFQGEKITGKALCRLSETYKSKPGVKDVDDDFSEGHQGPVNVTANITYIPPVEPEEITLQYRLNNQTWHSIKMKDTGEEWGAEIPEQDEGVKVDYRIKVTDMADKTIFSDIHSYTV